MASRGNAFFIHSPSSWDARHIFKPLPIFFEIIRIYFDVFGQRKIHILGREKTKKNNGTHSINAGTDEVKVLARMKMFKAQRFLQSCVVVVAIVREVYSVRHVKAAQSGIQLEEARRLTNWCGTSFAMSTSMSYITRCNAKMAQVPVAEIVATSSQLQKNYGFDVVALFVSRCVLSALGV